jgi:hypothetical protein
MIQPKPKEDHEEAKNTIRLHSRIQSVTSASNWFTTVTRPFPIAPAGDLIRAEDALGLATTYVSRPRPTDSQPLSTQAIFSVKSQQRFN